MACNATNVQFGCTLLHDAACGGSVELVTWLVEEKGLDVQEWSKVLCSIQVYIPLLCDHHKL